MQGTKHRMWGLIFRGVFFVRLEGTRPTDNQRHNNIISVILKQQLPYLRFTVIIQSMGGFGRFKIKEALKHLF